ncbi:MAG: SRPBCC family protein [Methylococcaceae bacterium]|nr:SRPBCC family protein [Methylococcaceae bacterium]
MNIRKLVIPVLLLLPSSVFAHGPTPQKAKESIEIIAPVEKSWESVKQFDKISEWYSDIKISTGDGKLESGGTRTLTFQNGEKLVDELDFFSDKDHEYSYRIKTENVKALPVSSYSVTVKVEPGNNDRSSIIILKSRFYRGDTGNTPPDNLNDEAAVKAMTNYFKNILSGLKQKIEQ